MDDLVNYKNIIIILIIICIIILRRKIIALSIILFWISYASFLCIVMILLYPLFLITGKSRKYTILVDQFCHYYWRTMTYVVEVWGGITLKFYGDSVPDRETVLLISNHLSYTDWTIIFCLAIRKARLGCCKFFVKDMVKWIPGIGWGLALNDSVFLKRNWNDDIEKIRRTFANLKKKKSSLIG